MDDAMKPLLRRLMESHRALLLILLAHVPRGSWGGVALACTLDELNVAIAALDD